MTQTLIPFLWFERDAEQAVAFYIATFGGRELTRFHYPEDTSAPVAGGTLGTIVFQIEGMELTAINGGTAPQYTDALSLMVVIEDQARLDRIWQAILDHGGTEIACGWIRDRWGLRWQLVPKVMSDLLRSPDRAAQVRAFETMLTMTRLDGPAIAAAARAA